MKFKELTEIMCATADKTALAPKSVPTSELYPHAWRHSAPNECKAGSLPEVKDVTQDSAMNIVSEFPLARATSKSAVPSKRSEAWARCRSNCSSSTNSRGWRVVAVEVFGLKYDIMTGAVRT